MDEVSHVRDRRTDGERERLVVDEPVTPRVDADQAREAPDRLAQPLEAPVVEDGDRDHLHVRGGAEIGLLHLVGLRERKERGLLDPRGRNLQPDDVERGGRLVGGTAEHDAVRVSEHAEERAAAAAVVVGALDQPGYLHELHEHAPDPRQRGYRPERREGVVARLDLDLRQRLQQR